MSRFKKGVSFFSDRVEVLGILILLFLAPFVYFPYTYNTFRLPKEVFASVIVVLIAGVTGIKVIEGRYGEGFYSIRKWIRELTYSENELDCCIGVFVFYALVTSLFSLTPLYSIRFGLYVSIYVILFLLIRFRLNFAVDSLRIQNTLIAAGVFMTLYAFLQYLGFDPLFHPVEPYMKGFLVTSGFIDNPNLLGGYLVPLIPIALCRTLDEGKKSMKILYSITLVLLITGVALTMARAALLALIVSGVYFVLVMRGLTLKRIIKGIVVLVAFLALFYVSNIYVFGKARRDLTLKDRSVQTRMLHWRVASAMITDDLRSFFIGKGLGTFSILYTDYRQKTVEKYPQDLKFEIAGHAHNEYIQVWAELGVIGLIVMLMIIFYYFREVFLLMDGGAQRISIAGNSAAVVAILCNSMGSFPLHIVPSALVLVAAAAMSLYPSIEEQDIKHLHQGDK